MTLYFTKLQCLVYLYTEPMLKYVSINFYDNQNICGATRPIILVEIQEDYLICLEYQCGCNIKLMNQNETLGLL